jgi:aryl-alcohol dehydrogenase-like predicted oxidoreductase
LRYKLLGKSGLRVAELCLGTMTFGEEWGFGAAKDESKAIYDAYTHAGGNFVDTANSYTDGSSERYVGEFIHSERDSIVLASKYTLIRKSGDPNASGNHRKNMKHSLEASLKRLNTDYVDLYWVHIWDFLTPVEEVMRGLDDLVRAGKILYIGISDTPAWVVSQANTLADLRGWTSFIGLQVEYSLIERTPERDLLPMARSLDIGVAAWAPLGSGVLTGKYNRPQQGSEQHRHAGEGPNSRRLNPRNLAIAEAVQAVADEIAQPASQVALNWLRQRPGVVIPVIGSRKAPQIKDNLACLNFTLTEAQLHHLDEASKIELGFPHDFSQMEIIKHITYGGFASSIDSHRPR